MELSRKSLKRSQVSRAAIIIIMAILPVLSGCKVTYSFTGASISPEVKTFSVQYFQNRAPLVQPGLSQALTDAVIDKCKAQTSLRYVTGMGDVNFEGEISDYNSRPATVGADETAATNRFTITVKVKYTNATNPELSYEQTFSRYMDFSGNTDLSSVEKDLSAKIIDLLVEDIFNQAFVNW